MKALILIVGFLALAACGGVIGIRDIQFDRGCKGHLKRATDANTVAIARSELQTAIGYAQQHGMTEGYTSVIYQTPDEDVGFWFRNLSSADAELASLRPTASELEKSNLLLKLRESLLDHNAKGDSVTVPDGISRYPYNMAFGVVGLLSGAMFLLGIVANDLIK